MIHIRLTASAILIFLISMSLSAAGRSETAGDAEGAGGTGTFAETLDVERRAEIQGILSEMGVQTFRNSIRAIDFSLDRLSGGQMAMADLTGKFVFLNFWATWCPPCREEMPSMEVLHNSLPDAPFQIVAVNVREDRGTVAPFIEEFGYTYPILLDTQGLLATNYGVRGIPTTFFIGPDGNVLGMLVGTRMWDEPEIMDGMQRIVDLIAAR